MMTRKNIHPIGGHGHPERLQECRRLSPKAERSPRRGYSLLEVLLALALSVAVFAAIAMSVRLYLVVLTDQKVMIERKQIARSVLAMISNDLRAGVQYKAADYSGLENLVKSQQMMISSFVAAAPVDGEAEVPIGEIPAELSPEEGESEEEDSGIIVEEEVSFRPSLLGSETVLMMDISRLPRLDQYNPLIASSETLNQSPSDVKSVAYFFSSSDGGAQQEIEFDSGAPGGLYRREVDRAVAAYQSDFELLESPDSYTKLVASEIAQIEFRYFDGSDWQTSWDSAEYGGFPPAIEITVVIDPARSSRENTTYAYSGFDSQTMEQYRLVVHLPVAEIIETEE